MHCSVNKPLISIVIPVYGVEAYIEQCARSLFEQTYENIEYIFVNDASPDRSIDILRNVMSQYPKRESQVIIIDHKTNQGLAHARRDGILAAHGEYIGGCDSDDWLEKDMCETMLHMAVDGDYDIVLSDMSCYSIDSTDYSLILCHCRDISFLLNGILLGDISACIPSCIFRRSLLDGGIIFPQFDMGEDIVLSVQLIDRTKKIGFVEHPFYHYRCHLGSISTTKNLVFTINRSRGYHSNMDVVFQYLAKRKIDSQYYDEIVFRKHIVKSSLCPFLYDNEAYKLWKSIYPELMYEVWNNKRIKFWVKCLYLLIWFGIYPCYLRLKRIALL